MVGGSSINSFFPKNGAPVQAFTVDATVGQMLKGSGGTMIYISPNSFVTQSNQAVTGNLTIELREIFSKRDMILSNVSSTSGGKPLISGGEFYFSAKQNGQKLKLAVNSGVYAEVPAGPHPSYQMKEFYAGTLDANNDWDSIPTQNSIQVFKDSMNPQYYYHFQIDSMNWINIDYFSVTPGPATAIAAGIGNDFDSSNCFVFIAFNGQNSAARFFPATDRIFSPGPYYTLPIGMSVTFVAISEKNGKYYSAFRSSVIVNNHIETLMLTSTTLAQIKQDLANLP